MGILDELYEVLRDSEFESQLIQWVESLQHLSVEKLKELKEILEELDDEDKAKFLFLMAEQGYEPEEALKYIDNIDFYPNQTLRDVAYGLLESDGVPDTYITYIDFDRFERDLRSDGYIETSIGVFRV